MIIAIMPAHNEEKSIKKVIGRTAKYVDKLIVVDDASTDRTNKIVKKMNVILITHKKNRGLGGALRSGFKKALEIAKNEDDIILTIDADGQHDPDEIPRFIKQVNKGYDFVLGKRNLSKYPFIKKFGNAFLNYMTNLICDTDLRDTESGFRAFTKRALKGMIFRAERYEIASEILYEVCRRAIKSSNVDISIPIYVKGVGIWDGFKNFWYLMKLRFG